MVLALMQSIFLCAQKAPEKAPADPDYHLTADELREMNENGVTLPPIKPLHDPWKNYQTKVGRDFPIVYDMRNTPWLTPVKSQSAGGCWAYSVMGALESRLLMLGLGEYDLSDNHLQNCHKYVPERSGNGNQWMATAFFARRSGPVMQNEYNYPGGGQYYNCCPDILQALYYVHQARYPAAQNQTAVKQTVLNYGAVWSLLYYNQTFLNTNNHTYYFGGSNAVNHAGCVVGWNDTLSTAGGTGAWIVRNTYGPNWADNGYYYISYNDSQFLKYNGYWPEVMENEENTVILQYDEIGGYWGAGGWNQTAYGLVKFEGAATDVLITKVGTYVVYANTTLEFRIFDQFNDSLSGLLGMIADTIVELPGYYTFDLDTEILIQPGHDFYIQVKYNSNDPTLMWPAAIEDTIVGYSKPIIETGKYWIAPDPNIWPTAWFPIGIETGLNWDLCIKAYSKKIITPIVVTGVASDIGSSWLLISSNNIISEGASPVSVRGVCWSKSENPTIEDDKTFEEGGMGYYASLISNLEPATPYFVRAYATNENGTGYGEPLQVTTRPGDIIHLTNLTIHTNTDTCFAALQTINVAGDGSSFTVEAGAIAEFIAGHSIVLQTGTIFNDGSIVTARISNDYSFCNNPESIFKTPHEYAPLLNDLKCNPTNPFYFSAYPNPANGLFFLDFDPSIVSLVLKIEVYDLQGKCLIANQITGVSHHQLDLSGRKAGIYLVRVTSGLETNMLKLIKL